MCYKRSRTSLDVDLIQAQSIEARPHNSEALCISVSNELAALIRASAHAITRGRTKFQPRHRFLFFCSERRNMRRQANNGIAEIAP